jgi:copper(I)-binding protein
LIKSRLLSCVAAALAATVALAVQAGEVTRAGTLEIDTPWARASVGTGRPTAAYLTIRNTGDRPDRLIEVTTPVAGHAATHAMVHEDGVMKMRPAGPLEIPPGGELRLAPGGELHIMLMALKEPLKEGASLPLTLVFESAGEITLEAPIAGLAADAPPP